MIVPAAAPAPEDTPMIDWMTPALQWRGGDVALPLLQVLLVLLGAWLLNALLRRALRRVCERYELPPAFIIGTRRLLGIVIYVAAFLLALNRLGVSGAVVWSTLTGFVAVGAVAFFAVWSVLSNIFCTLLILTTRPFRLHDYIEILEGGDKPGLRGQVVDIHFVYTTLEETHEDGSRSLLQVPNSQFFQRAIRRWQGEPPVLARGEDNGGQARQG
jgi:small-conductance mechanosensitive channel